MAVEGGVVFLFDENLPPRLARALRELGQRVVHVTDEEVALRGEPDEAVLRYAGERGWCVVTADQAILHRPLQRAVLSELRMGAFFVNDTLRGECRLAGAIVRHWPEMKRLAQSRDRPFLYQVRERTLAPIRRRSLGPPLRRESDR